MRISAKGHHLSSINVHTALSSKDVAVTAFFPEVESPN